MYILTTVLCARRKAVDAFECSRQTVERGRCVVKPVFRMLETSLSSKGDLEKLKELMSKLFTASWNTTNLEGTFRVVGSCLQTNHIEILVVQFSNIDNNIVFSIDFVKKSNLVDEEAGCYIDQSRTRLLRFGFVISITRFHTGL